MNIAVCVKQVIDTEAETKLDPSSWRSGPQRHLQSSTRTTSTRWRRRCASRRPTAARSSRSAWDPRMPSDAVRKALAMGADNAILVSDAALAGSDAQATAYVLAEALKSIQCDLVIFGRTFHRRRDRVRAGRRGRTPGHAAAVRLVQGRGAAASSYRVHRETDQGYVAYRVPHPGGALRDQGHQRAALSLHEGHHGREEEAPRHEGRSALCLWTRPRSAWRPPRPASSPPAFPNRARPESKSRTMVRAPQQDRRFPGGREARLGGGEEQ